MYVLPQYRLLYLATPRTATRATERTLAQFGGQKVGPDHNTMFNIKNPNGWDGWTFFTAVRNHWDALVSWFFLDWWTRREYPGLPVLWNNNFSEFVPTLVQNVKKHFLPRQMYGIHQPHCTHIMRFENLQADFDKVLATVGLPPAKLVVNNVSQARAKQPYQAYYTAELRDWVAHWFRDEIARYNYTFEEL